MLLEVIFILKSVYASFSMKWKPGLIPSLLKYSVNYVKACIIYLSLLFFIAVVRMELQSYIYMKYIYSPHLIELVGKCPHISDYIFPSLVVLGSTVVKNTTFVLIFSSKSVSSGFLWSIVALVFSCAGVQLFYSLIFQGDS